MNTLRQARLLFWTLRYLSFRQVAARVLRMCRRRLDRWTRATTLARQEPAVRSIQIVSQELLRLKTGAEWNDRCAIADAAMAGRFGFLGREVHFDDRIAWNDPGLSQLWRYHLHYFHFVIDLAIRARCKERAETFESFRELVTSWIHENAAIQGDGWHPYTLSLRTVNWIEGFHAFQDEINQDPEFRALMLKSLHRQAEILHRDREFDVRGNHLLENLRALIWLGMFFEGTEAERWNAEAIRGLEVEVAEQVLVDGGHFERSPGYHVLVLKDLVEIGWLLRRNGRSMPGWLAAAIDRMTRYLGMIVTPVGRVPLLKDTAVDASPDAADVATVSAVLLDDPTLKPVGASGALSALWLTEEERLRVRGWPVTATGTGMELAPSSGHCVMRESEAGHFLVFDVGKVCPDYLPAHGQADLFTYELFVDRIPVVVDSGIYEYAQGAWRDFFRSTRAHNTLEIERCNQSEVWSSFRVARRAHVVEVRTGGQDDMNWCLARHDGYRRHYGDHERILVWIRPDIWLVIDHVPGKSGVHYRNHVHLHPDLRAEKSDGECYAIQLPDRTVSITGFGHQERYCSQGMLEDGRQGWYSEHFGVRQENQVLTFAGQTRQRIPCGYVISAGSTVKSIKTDARKTGWELELTTSDAAVVICRAEGKLTVNQQSHIAS